MEFKLPFLSLKSLSSLRICQQWADNKLGPFQDFSTAQDSKMLREKRSHLILDGFQIYPSLKAIVGDVLFGILWSVRIWRNRHKTTLAEEVQFFKFDASGRLDEKRTLKPVFQIKVAEENDLSSLHKLLTDAYDFWLLPEVDAILRKMVAIASNRLRSKILMEGPRPELRHGKYHVVYRFVQKDAAQYLETIRYPDSADRASIVLERESIAVTRCSKTRYWNLDAFKDHIDLFEPPNKPPQHATCNFEQETYVFIENVLWNPRYRSMGVENQLDILAFLKQKNYPRPWSVEICSCCWNNIGRMVMWPFISYFIVALKHVAPILKFKDYVYFFVIIAGSMPAEQQYGVLHVDLLKYIWSVLTVDEKRRCATDNFFPESMKRLKVKVPFLHDKIKNEMTAMY